MKLDSLEVYREIIKVIWEKNLVVVYDVMFMYIMSVRCLVLKV